MHKLLILLMGSLIFNTTVQAKNLDADKTSIHCEGISDSFEDNLFKIKEGAVEYNDGWDLLDTPAKGTVTKIEKDEGVFTIEGVLMADQNEGVDKDVAYEAELNTKDKSVYVKTDDDTYTWLAPHFLSCSATLEITEK